MMRTRLTMLAAVFVGWLAPGWPSVARAGDEDIARFGTVAREQFEAGRYEAALNAYVALESLLSGGDRPALERAAARCSIARCEEELGRDLDAIESYEECIGPELPEAMRAGFAQRLETLLRTRVGELEVQCKPASARVTITRRGTAPLGPMPCGNRWARLLPGSYAVEARDANGQVATTSVVVAGGKVHQVSIHIMPAPVPVPVRQPASPRVQVREDVPIPLPSRGRPLAWIATGGAAVALVGGGVFFALAQGDLDAGDEAHQRYLETDNAAEGARLAADVRASDDSAKTNAAVSYTLLGLGAVAGGVATWLWLRDDSGDVTAIAIDPGGAHVRWSW